MMTGECKSGENCKFHHPIDRSAPSLLKQAQQQAVKLTLAGLPRREVGNVHVLRIKCSISTYFTHKHKHFLSLQSLQEILHSGK